MTDDFEDFAQWRGGVDERLGRLEPKVETEAHLRAKMDGDMGKLHAEFRAQRSMLQALHDTQQDHSARLVRVEDRLVRVEDRLVRVEDRLVRVEDRLVRVEDRLVRVEDRLVSVEGALQLVRVGVEAIHGKLDTLIDRD
jgi:chromosome segregation ATPase